MVARALSVFITFAIGTTVVDQEDTLESSPQGISTETYYSTSRSMEEWAANPIRSTTTDNLVKYVWLVTNVADGVCGLVLTEPVPATRTITVRVACPTAEQISRVWVEVGARNW